jgi:hypothetical protein
MKIMKACLKGVTMVSLITMGTAAMFSSCSKDNGLTNDIDSDDLTEIKLTSTIVNGNISSWTRTRGDGDGTTLDAKYVESGESLRLCVNDATDGTRLYLQDITATGDEGKMTGEKTMYFPVSGNNVDLYAYRGTYDFKSNNNEEIVKEGTTMNASVLEDQSSDDGYTNSDFIFGETLNQERTHKQVEITLGHVFSRIVVTVKGSEDIAGREMKLTKIKVNGSIIKGTYKIGNETNTWETSTSDDYKKDITFYDYADGVAITEDEVVKEQKAVIVPQSMAGNTLELVTNDNGKSFTYTFPKDTEYEAGKSYNYTVTLSSYGLNVTAKITNWDEQENKEISADFDVPTSNK